MSIHAKLSPEAQSRLAAERKRSSITSIIIAILSSAFIGFLLFVISIAMPKRELPTITTAWVPPTSDDEELVVKRTTTNRKQKPASASSRTQVITSVNASQTALPVTEFELPEPTLDLGDDGFGEGFGEGDGGGGGGGYGSLTSTFSKRCSKADRLNRIDEMGGLPECDEAVDNALKFLQDKQNSDGSWGTKHKPGMTGLVLLAYLGRCETPLSLEYGDTVLKATSYLVALGVNNDGKLSDDFNGHWSYDHAVATYALCECLTFSTQLGYTVPQLSESTEKAVRWIIDKQDKSGSWSYTYQGGRQDTSIDAWHMQALKAAQSTGVKFQHIDKAIRGGLTALEKNQNSEGGFGYNNPAKKLNDYYNLTGAGTLCFQQHKGTKNRIAKKGLSYIKNSFPFDWKSDADIYAHYYASQAMMNAGGSAWQSYNRKIRDEILQHQNNDGSWGKPGGKQPGFQSGAIYSTALTTLILEVYYRFLPGTMAH